MQNRRDFIRQATMMIAGAGLMPSLLSSCENAAGASKTIGLQLYSLRDLVKETGIRNVLEVVAKMGYKHLETAGYNDGKLYDMAPKEFRKLVEDLGMKATSAHLSRNISENKDEDMAWWDKAVEANSAAGASYMIMPISPLRGEGAHMDNVKRYGDYFSEIGLITAASSVQFGYHNHDFEFKHKIDGVPVYDLLMQNTSADHVLFELDVYWVYIGGYDPVEYMRRYANRIKLYHIKGETSVGSSDIIDYKAVFEQAYAGGMKDWFVEVERYDGTPEEDVKKSFDYLHNAAFVK